MPAMLDDPTAPVIYRRSGEDPHGAPGMALPPDVFPRPVTLRDRTTIATLIPFNSPDQVPLSLMSYLCDLLNREIEKGDTYPMVDPMPLENFGVYWFANFGAVMVLGDVHGGADEVMQMDREGRVNWARDCLGAFYIKPNYPGRSSHVCNGGFLVTDASRNRGVGRLMGEGYIDWAPRLGYTYSVFNLVYETNVASCRIWDGLGFKRIGRVKGCGNLRSYPDQLIDAIIYGRELGAEGEDTATEERFEKIKFYLKNGQYPAGADRAEKSRLRSAATHYKLIPAGDGGEAERLMLKDKEVVAEPQQQYELARRIHLQHHGGINKTTASIAEKYHWVRIKDTVSQVIKNCSECRDMAEQRGLKSDKSLSTNQGSTVSGTHTSTPPQQLLGEQAPQEQMRQDHSQLLQQQQFQQHQEQHQQRMEQERLEEQIELQHLQQQQQQQQQQNHHHQHLHQQQQLQQHLLEQSQSHLQSPVHSPSLHQVEGPILLDFARPPESLATNSTTALASPDTQSHQLLRDIPPYNFVAVDPGMANALADGATHPGLDYPNHAHVLNASMLPVQTHYNVALPMASGLVTNNQLYIDPPIGMSTEDLASALDNAIHPGQFSIDPQSAASLGASLQGLKDAAGWQYPSSDNPQGQ